MAIFSSVRVSECVILFVIANSVDGGLLVEIKGGILILKKVSAHGFSIGTLRVD